MLRNKIDGKFELKTSFFVLVPSHVDSPNFRHVILLLGIVLYRNHLVSDRQGSAAHVIKKSLSLPYCNIQCLSSVLFNPVWVGVLLNNKMCNIFDRICYLVIRQRFRAQNSRLRHLDELHNRNELQNETFIGADYQLSICCPSVLQISFSRSN